MPYLTKAEIEAIAARVVRAYTKLPVLRGIRVRRIDPERLAKDLLGLKVQYKHLACREEVLGLTSLGEVDIEVIGEGGELLYQHVDGKTIVVDFSLLSEFAVAGHLNFTLMHEACHQIYKMLFPRSYSNESEKGKVHYCKRRTKRRKTDWEEWRTDSLAAAILMPPELIKYYLQKYGFGEKMKILNRVFADEEYERFCMIADELGVSKTALAIRLRELGLLENDYFRNPFDLINVYVDDNWMKTEGH